VAARRGDRFAARPGGDAAIALATWGAGERTESIRLLATAFGLSDSRPGWSRAGGERGDDGGVNHRPQEDVVEPVPLLDRAGRRRSPATTSTFHQGLPPRNEGRRYPPDPPTVEEIVAVMRAAGDDPDRGAVLIRHGKGDSVAGSGWIVGLGRTIPTSGLCRPRLRSRCKRRHLLWLVSA
jgi:hypothetical protein